MEHALPCFWSVNDQSLVIKKAKIEDLVGFSSIFGGSGNSCSELD